MVPLSIPGAGFRFNFYPVTFSVTMPSMYVATEERELLFISIFVMLSMKEPGKTILLLGKRNKLSYTETTKNLPYSP